MITVPFFFFIGFYLVNVLGTKQSKNPEGYFLLIMGHFLSFQRHHAALQRDPSAQTGNARGLGPAAGERQHGGVGTEQTERQLRDAATEEILRGSSTEKGGMGGESKEDEGECAHAEATRWTHLCLN